jgi:hypothetical protein
MIPIELNSKTPFAGKEVTLVAMGINKIFVMTLDYMIYAWV